LDANANCSLLIKNVKYKDCKPPLYRFRNKLPNAGYEYNAHGWFNEMEAHRYSRPVQW